MRPLEPTVSRSASALGRGATAMPTAPQHPHVGGPYLAQPHDRMQLLPKSEVCRLFGGINASTLYRGIRQGRYPKPVRVGPNSSRWLLAECQAALRAMVEERR